MLINKYLFLLILVFFFGCSTIPKNQPISTKKSETISDVKKAISAVAGTMVGKELNEEDFKNLEKQIKNDPDAKSAIEQITNTMGNPPRIKYCPVDGKRYSPDLKFCPEHKVLLKELDE